MNNYNTKYSKGDTVRIKAGLLRGVEGVVDDYIPNGTRGLMSDNGARGLPQGLGVYVLKLDRRWWQTKQTVTVEEESLELLK